MIRLLLIIAFIFLCNPASAQAPPGRSLMFTKEEEEMLRAVLRGVKIVGSEKLDKEETEEVIEAAKPRQINISLSALLYTGPNDWVAWINDARITPGLQTKDFTVSAVTDRYVEIIPAWQEIKIRLAPRQTFHAGSGMVVEGIIK
jgi:hypothetical protein